MRATATHRAALVLLVAATLLAAGCGASLNLAPEGLPAPAISLGGVAAQTCLAPGTAATLSLSDVGTTITLGAGGQLPENRIDVVGTATGLAVGEAVFVTLIPLSSDCPVLRTTDAVVAPDGSFTAQLDLAANEAFRVVAMSLFDDGTQVVGCDLAQDCLTSDGAATGISGSLVVRTR